MRRPVQWNYAAGARVARRVGKTNLPRSIANGRPKKKYYQKLTNACTSYAPLWWSVGFLYPIAQSCRTAWTDKRRRKTASARLCCLDTKICCENENRQRDRERRKNSSDKSIFGECVKSGCITQELAILIFEGL